MSVGNGHAPVVDLEQRIAALEAENHRLQGVKYGLELDLEEAEFEVSSTRQRLRDFRHERRGGGTQFAIRRADPSKMRPTEFVWRPWIVRGRLNEIVGEERAGKSTFSAYIAAGITNGTLPGDFEGKPMGVLFIGCDEDSWENDTMPRLRAAGADFDRIRVFEGDLNIERDTDALRKLLTKGQEPSGAPPVFDADVLAQHDGPVPADDPDSERLGLIVVEHAMDVLPPMRNFNDPAAMRQVFKPLRRLLREINVPALLTRHTNKAATTEFRQAAQGSMQFGAMARSSFLIARHPADPDRRIAVLGPANYVPEGETPALSFTIESYEFEENGRHFNLGRVADIDAGDESTMAEALGSSAPARQRKRDESYEQILRGLPVASTREMATGNPPPITTAALAVKLGKSKNDGTIRRRLADLKASGRVEQVDGGWYRIENDAEDDRFA